MRKKSLFVIALLFFILIGTPAWATDYYVATNGNDSWNGQASAYQSGSIGPWKTITKANQALKAGDTVLIEGGTYSVGISPAKNGEPGKPIVYRNYDAQEVLLTGLNVAVWLTDKQYITVIGIAATGVNCHVSLNNCNNVLIEECRFDYANNGLPNSWGKCITIKINSHHNTIRGCTISRGGQCLGTQNGGSVINIGNWQNLSDHCDYNLFENNILFYGGHDIIELMGRYNVIRNNYFHNEPWSGCCCDRTETGGICGARDIVIGYESSQCERNLIEGNRLAFTGVPPQSSTAFGMSVRAPRNIIRKNSFYCNDGGGLSLSSYKPDEYGTNDASHNKVFNNTFFHNGYSVLQKLIDQNHEQWQQVGMLVARFETGVVAKHIVIKNNVFHDNKSNPIEFYNGPIREEQEVLNNWEHAGDPLFVSADTAATPFGTPPDFHLRRESPCIDSGGFLTTIVSASGSGTSLQVADAGYFVDGWSIEHVLGDEIQLQGSLQRARITAVNYITNTITVDKTLTWALNQGVSLAYEGSAPDIGAYEYIPSLVQSLSLTAGWNWVSFNVLPAELSLNSIFSDILGQIEQIKTQTQSTIRGNNAWKGDLADMSGIGQYKMYKVKVNTACTLTVTGTAVPSATSIPLAGGWNWVGYYPQSNLPIGQALSSIASSVQQAKSQTQSANYQSGSWLGDLTQLEPGKGYTIKVSSPVNLVYPEGK
jgi:hypothetical protein